MNKRLPRDRLRRLSQLIGPDLARKWLRILTKHKTAKPAGLRPSQKVSGQHPNRLHDRG